MKLRCEIIETCALGTELRLKLQGTTKNAAEWRSLCPQILEIPQNAKSSKAFHVGRIVTISLKAE